MTGPPSIEDSPLFFRRRRRRLRFWLGADGSGPACCGNGVLTLGDRVPAADGGGGENTVREGVS
ncbi:MAG TPA: hypothetical protein VGI70_03620, partial [Polyangiales bacterium]